MALRIRVADGIVSTTFPSTFHDLERRNLIASFSADDIPAGDENGWSGAHKITNSANIYVSFAAFI
eukprot:1116168-Amorphochlora_amoeboformis.AAC.2